MDTSIAALLARHTEVEQALQQQAGSEFEQKKQVFGKKLARAGYPDLLPHVDELAMMCSLMYCTLPFTNEDSNRVKQQVKMHRSMPGIQLPRLTGLYEFNLYAIDLAHRKDWQQQMSSRAAGSPLGSDQPPGEPTRLSEKLLGLPRVLKPRLFTQSKSTRSNGEREREREGVATGEREGADKGEGTDEGKGRDEADGRRVQRASMPAAPRRSSSTASALLATKEHAVELSSVLAAKAHAAEQACERLLCEQAVGTAKSGMGAALQASVVHRRNAVQGDAVKGHAESVRSLFHLADTKLRNGFNQRWVDVAVALCFFPVDWIARLAANDFLDSPNLMAGSYLEWSAAVRALSNSGQLSASASSALKELAETLELAPAACLDYMASRVGLKPPGKASGIRACAATISHDQHRAQLLPD